MEDLDASIIILDLTIKAFTSIGFIGLIVYLNRQLKSSVVSLKGLRMLTIVGWINICIIPAFYPPWFVRLFGIAAMGVCILYFLYHNYNPTMIVLLEPEEIKAEIKPLVNVNCDRHAQWAKEAGDKLDQLIGSLRGETDATRSD